MWTVAKAEGGRHWKDCGGPENQQLGLTDTIRAHAYNTRLCSTMFSPWLQSGQTYLRQVSQCPSDAAFIFMSISIQEKPIFISNCIFYISCSVENIYALFELGDMPDFRALRKGWISEIHLKTKCLMASTGLWCQSHLLPQQNVIAYCWSLFDGLNIATVSKETITVWFMLFQLAWGEKKKKKRKSLTKFLCSDAIRSQILFYPVTAYFIQS